MSRIVRSTLHQTVVYLVPGGSGRHGPGRHRQNSNPMTGTRLLPFHRIHHPVFCMVMFFGTIFTDRFFTVRVWQEYLKGLIPSCSLPFGSCPLPRTDRTGPPTTPAHCWDRSAGHRPGPGRKTRLWCVSLKCVKHLIKVVH